MDAVNKRSASVARPLLRPYAGAVVGGIANEPQVVLDANERARVAREHDDRERAEDAVDRTAREPKLAKVRSREQRA